MFKTKAIILQIQRVRDNKTRIVLFTKEYGKITCWYKKKWCIWDLGDIIVSTIDRHLGENILKDIEITDRAHVDHWNFATIISFLEIINLFYSLLPDSVPHHHIFDDYTILIKTIKWLDVLYLSHYSLFQLRILKMLGFINDQDFQKTPRLHYIHNNISSSSLRNIFQSKPLSEEEWRFIQEINHRTIYQLA